jgi:hypothetical protein
LRIDTAKVNKKMKENAHNFHFLIFIMSPLRGSFFPFIFPFPLSTLNLNGFARAGWLREALWCKARMGGSRWGRGGKKASL